MAIWSAGFVQHLPAPSMVRWQSCPSTIGHITLGPKQTGAPSAGNPHAGCDVAGAGNGFTVWLLRHSQRKRGATARLNLRNTAPVLDPTGLWEVISALCIVICALQTIRLSNRVFSHSVMNRMTPFVC